MENRRKEDFYGTLDTATYDHFAACACGDAADRSGVEAMAREEIFPGADDPDPGHCGADPAAGGRQARVIFGAGLRSFAARPLLASCSFAF